MFAISTLRSIDLSHNLIDGILPDGLTLFATLDDVRLNDNELTGAYPEGFTDLCHGLMNIEVHNNHFLCELVEFCNGTCVECFTIGTSCLGADCYGWEKDGVLMEGVMDESIEVCTNEPGEYRQLTYFNGELLCDETFLIGPECDGISVDISSNQQAFCDPGASITLTASAGFEQYIWESGAGVTWPKGNRFGRDITIRQPGSFRLQAKDENNCVAVASISVEIDEPVYLSFEGYNPVGCPGDPVDICVVTNATEITWINVLGDVIGVGKVLSDFNVESHGSTLTVVGKKGNCEKTIAVAIESPDLLQEIIPSQPQICLGEEITLEALGPIGQYKWYNGQNEVVVSAPLVTIIGLTETETFTVELVREGCVQRLSTTIEVLSPPSLSIVADPSTIICPAGGSTTLSVAGDFTLAAWDHGEVGTSIEVSEAGTYGLTTTSPDGCESSASIAITEGPGPISIDAGADQSICPGSSVTLTATGSGGTFLWSNDEAAASTIVSPSVTTTYSVSLTSGGCTLTDDVVVTVLDDNNPNNIKSYFENLNFYQLNITIDDPVTSQRRNTLIYTDDYAQQLIFRDESSQTLNVADIIDEYLTRDLFSSNDNLLGVVTKNEDFNCLAGPLDLDIIAASFDDKDWGYWAHQWKDPNGMQDILFLGIKNPDQQNVTGPEDEAHKTFMDEDLARVRNGVYYNPYTNIDALLIDHTLFNSSSQLLSFENPTAGAASASVAVVSSCILDGTFEEGKVRTEGWDWEECTKGAFSALIIEVLLDKLPKGSIKNIRYVPRRNFVKGLSRLLEDLGSSIADLSSFYTFNKSVFGSPLDNAKVKAYFDLADDADAHTI